MRGPEHGGVPGGGGAAGAQAGAGLHLADSVEQAVHGRGRADIAGDQDAALAERINKM